VCCDPGIDKVGSQLLACIFGSAVLRVALACFESRREELLVEADTAQMVVAAEDLEECELLNVHGGAPVQLALNHADRCRNGSLDGAMQIQSRHQQFGAVGGVNHWTTPGVQALQTATVRAQADLARALPHQTAATSTSAGPL